MILLKTVVFTETTKNNKIKNKTTCHFTGLLGTLKMDSQPTS